MDTAALASFLVVHELGLLTHGILEARKTERRKALAFLDRVLREVAPGERAFGCSGARGDGYQGGGEVPDRAAHSVAKTRQAGPRNLYSRGLTLSPCEDRAVMHRSLTLTLVTLVAFALTAPGISAQTLLGSDNVNLLAWEFSPAQANPCPQPNPFVASCSISSPVCGFPSPGFAQPGQFWGDIADDPLTDTFYMTGGRIIEQYSLGHALRRAAHLWSDQQLPGLTSMSEITGLGFDNTGGVVAPAGTPLLWITDGRQIAAVTPGPCSLTIVFGPCLVTGLAAGEFMTDCTWDPFVGCLWVSTNFGQRAPRRRHRLQHRLELPGRVLHGCHEPPHGHRLRHGHPGHSAAGGLAAHPLRDGRPARGARHHDGRCARAHLRFADVLHTHAVGALGPGSHPAWWHLRHQPHRRAARHLRAVQHPWPTFGLEVINPPAGANAWLILNFNFPGPGFFCPSVPAVGTQLWVDPAPPATVTNLGPLPPGCTPIPLPVPGAVPAGLEMFAQFVFIPTTGPPAVDATNAIYSTVMLP